MGGGTVGFRAVLFDLGHTLLDYPFEGTWREYLRARLEELHPIIWEAVGRPALTVGEFAQRAAELIGGERARQIEHSGRSWHFADRLRKALLALGLSCDARRMERVTEQLLDSVRVRVAPYADTHDALTRLRAGGLKLAVTSNSPWDTPGRLGRADMERCAIAQFFDAMVFSGDVPWRKPNPEFMWAAARALEVEARECLVVGDTPRADIRGARAAGMRSVWVNRSGDPLPEGEETPDWSVASLSEVAPIAAGARGRGDQ